MPDREERCGGTLGRPVMLCNDPEIECPGCIDCTPADTEGDRKEHDDPTLANPTAQAASGAPPVALRGSDEVVGRAVADRPNVQEALRGGAEAERAAVAADTESGEWCPTCGSKKRKKRKKVEDAPGTPSPGGALIEPVRKHRCHDPWHREAWGRVPDAEGATGASSAAHECPVDVDCPGGERCPHPSPDPDPALPAVEEPMERWSAERCGNCGYVETVAASCCPRCGSKNDYPERIEVCRYSDAQARELRICEIYNDAVITENKLRCAAEKRAAKAEALRQGLIDAMRADAEEGRYVPAVGLREAVARVEQAEEALRELREPGLDPKDRRRIIDAALNPSDPSPERQPETVEGETNRETADRNLRRYAESLRRGQGNPGVIRRKLDDWLEYRKREQDNGTLDERTKL